MGATVQWVRSRWLSIAITTAVVLLVAGVSTWLAVDANQPPPLSVQQQAMAAACSYDWNWNEGGVENADDLKGAISRTHTTTTPDAILKKALAGGCPDGSIGDGLRVYRGYLKDIAPPTPTPDPAPASEPAADPLPATQPTEDTSAQDGSGQDTSVQDDLAARGITPQLVDMLGSVAHDTGYGPDLRPMTHAEASDLAEEMLYICDAVSSGQMTWQDQVDQDIADGAPPASANEMDAFLENTFCP